MKKMVLMMAVGAALLGAAGCSVQTAETVEAASLEGEAMQSPSHVELKGVRRVSALQTPSYWECRAFCAEIVPDGCASQEECMPDCMELYTVYDGCEAELEDAMHCIADAPDGLECHYPHECDELTAIAELCRTSK